MSRRFLFTLSLSVSVSVSLFAQDAKTGTVKVRKRVGKDTLISSLERDTLISNEGFISRETGTFISNQDMTPAYSGGEAALRAYIEKNRVCPPRAGKAGIKGDVWVSFLVGVDGARSRFKLESKRLGYGCDEEALRVVQAVPGKWVSGKKNGVLTSVKYIVIVSFPGTK